MVVVAASPFCELFEEITTSLNEEVCAENAADQAKEEAPVEYEQADLSEADVDVRAKNQGIDGDPALTELTDVTELNERKLAQFKTMARELVRSNVCLCDETMDDDDIIKALAESPAGTARGDAVRHTHVCIYYDQQDAGEATAQPHLRVPPLRNKGQHLQRFLNIVMSRVETQDDLDEGDMYAINDAGRHGNKTQILNAFTNKENQVNAYLHS